MNAHRLAALLLIAAFATVMFVSFVTPPGLYQPQDLEDFDRRIEERLQILETHRTRWLTERALVVVNGLLTIAGFSLLAYVLRPGGASRTPVLGAVAMVAGTIVGLYFVYQQTIDPRGGYTRAYATAEDLAYWFWLAGTLLFGIAFVQGGLPNWLGYLTIGAAGLSAVVFLVTGFGFLTPWIVGFLGLVIGIVLLRDSPSLQAPSTRRSSTV